MSEKKGLMGNKCSPADVRKRTGGICIYAEQFENRVEESAFELITAARKLSAQSGGNITALVFGNDPSTLARQLSFSDVQVAVVKTDIPALQDDALSVGVAEALEQLAPDSVLIPANRTCRALFSRVAVRLNAGMTADCSELFVDGSGEFLQRKSAFGENAMCVTAETSTPKLVSMQIGVYAPSVPDGEEVSYVSLDVSQPYSVIEFLEAVEESSEPITGAERIISIGRGVGDNFIAVNELARKMEARIGGTRPLVDDGVIPFECQIGQTGCTVHPKICLYLGVSGAIQHTEGVRDTKLTIAVNKDPEAGIFGYVDYGVSADMKDIVKELINAYGQ